MAGGWAEGLFVLPIEGWPRARRRCGARLRASTGSPRASRRLPRGFEGGADGPHCVRGPCVGFFWVISFLPDWMEAVGIRGPGCLTCVCLYGDFSPLIRVPLIMVPDMIILSGRQGRCKFRRIISPYISLLMNRDIVRSSDRSGMNQVSYVLMHGHRCRTFRLNSCLSSET